MKVASSRVASFDVVKMEDRKRPAVDDVDRSTPPAKRQAVTVNGGSAHPDTDMPWKDEIEEYQKDAILRQMKDYKRQAQDLESQLSTLRKKSLYHDDHLRAIDAWFSQLLDEVSLLSNADPPEDSKSLEFSTSLRPLDNKQFEEHLGQRSDEIKSAISRLFAKQSISSPDVKELQARLSKLLAAEKSHASELERLTLEKDQLSERLENASYRYMVAEKKLDRTKSAQVAKLEAQAIQQSRALPKDESETKDGEAKASEDKEESTYGSETERARKEAVAVSEKRAEQLEKLVEENRKLMEQLTAAQVKASNLTEDDYANCELFKTLRAQYEDVVKRANDLEATCSQLRNDIKQAQSERTAYRDEIDNELRNATIETESQMARQEADLARIRHARDELIAKLSVKDAAENEQKKSIEQMKELASSREDRIEALEAELGGLRKSDQVDGSEEAAEDNDGEDLTTLRTKVKSAERSRALLESELRSMEQAYKKAAGIANKKVVDHAETEERISRLTAEKAKADQKYFATMKAKEMRDVEIRTLRQQNSKSSEIVSQLKDAESGCRTLISSLEKQLAEVKESVATISTQYRTAQQSLTLEKSTSERLEAQASDLKTTLSGKDSTYQEAMQAHRQSETEIAELKVRLEEAQLSSESWKKKSLGNQSEETEMLRTLCICTVCRRNFKNTALKTCGHTFCQECVDERISARSRKCPNCSKAFGSGDHMRITL